MVNLLGKLWFAIPSGVRKIRISASLPQMDIPLFHTPRQKQLLVFKVLLDFMKNGQKISVLTIFRLQGIYLVFFVVTQL